MASAQSIIRTYLTLQFGNTLAASLIWGINTLFLLNAGLTNFEAFLANSFFTLGMVLFEVPTGIVADSHGRRLSYLLGTVTLATSTLFYYGLWVLHAPFVWWAIASVLLGLGFTFFSGAVEAWLVDALGESDFRGDLEKVFGKGQTINGIAMLIGTLGGGVIAQLFSLGAPYIVRGVILIILLVIAWLTMHDIGFAPERTQSPLRAMSALLNQSVEHGLKVPAIKWLMFSSTLLSGVGFYVFYALQPYLLQLYGNNQAYIIAGLAASLVAVSQIIGGVMAGKFRKLFKKRASALVSLAAISCLVLVALYVMHNFYVALFLVFIWGITFSMTMPIRQSYLNSMIPKSQRATILSFDSMLGNIGGSIIQPGLARAADIWSYGTSFALGSVFQICALPMLIRSRYFRHISKGLK